MNETRVSRFALDAACARIGFTHVAQRGAADHNGFANRARRGARAENVATGIKTNQQAIALARDLAEVPFQLR